MALPPRTVTDASGRDHLIAQHTLLAVYGEMLLEICFAYSTLPDPRTLELDEIEFFYDGLRPSLRKRRT